MSAPSIDGVLVINKPRGPTSHDVVALVRRRLGTRRVGHAGTLDPMATGVLVVAVGEATKLVPWLTAHDKGYEASIALGVETDTLDAAGREVRRVEPSQALLGTLLAEGRNVPGRHGKRSTGTVRAVRTQRRWPRPSPASERARCRCLPCTRPSERTASAPSRAPVAARTLELAARAVVVRRRLALVGCTADPPSLAIEVETGKGYYVRALARDLAEGLGTVGHLTALRRTRSGCFVVDEAAQLDASPDELRARVVPLATAAARALPVVRLGVTGARDARPGRPVVATELEIADALAGTARIPRVPSAWLDADGTLVAVGQIEDDGRGRVLRGFGGEAPPEG